MKKMLLAIFSFSCLCLHAQPTTVGTTEGVFNVSDLGAANYTIPVKIPEGLGSVQPGISLSYSSQGANGIMGTGWNIGGMSAIVRIPNTIYHDKKVSGVSLTTEDRFALDGVRLMVSSGSYGAANSQYRTEVESYKEIKANGTLGSGPQSFTITDQNGWTYDYGSAADARAQISGKAEPYMWLLKKVTDLNGNYMIYEYSGQPGESVVPLRIWYNGNSTTGATAKTAIVFTTEQRYDPNFTYVAGGKITQNLRLKSIDVTQQDAGGIFQNIRSYKLDYMTETLTHLIGVTEKGYLNAESLPTTILTYHPSTTEVQYGSQGDIGVPAQISDFATGDYNGDGKTDVLLYPIQNNSSYNYHLFLNNGNGGFIQSQAAHFNNDPAISDNRISNVLKLRATEGIPFDINGDGKEDFVYLQQYKSSNNKDCNTLQTYWIYTSTGTGLTLAGKVKSPYASHTTLANTAPFTGDFDGDGKTELLLLNNCKESPARTCYLIGDNYCTYTVDPSGPVYNPLALTGAQMPFDASFIEEGKSIIRVIDYDGDGKNEILSIWRDEATGTDHAQVLKMNVTFDANRKPVLGNPAFTLVNDAGYPTIFHDVYTGDFNGDGITDVLTYNNNGGWRTGYGKGNGQMNDIYPAPFITIKPRRSNGKLYRPIILNDFNGDGKCDIFEYASNDPDAYYEFGQFQSPRVIYSVGKNVFYKEDLPIDNSELGRFLADYYLGDYNGDGQTELLTINKNRNQVHKLSFHPNENKHLLAEVNNGLGASTKLTYLPITNNITYDPNNSSSGSNVNYTYPYQERTVPMKVVSKVNSDNGIDTIGNNTIYHYHGLKYHVQGKGLLGFDAVTITDIAKGISIEKKFALDTNYVFPWLQSTLIKTTTQPISFTTSKQQVFQWSYNSNVCFYPYTTETITTDYSKNTTVTETYHYTQSAQLSAVSSKDIGKPVSIITNKGNGLEVVTQSFTYPNLTEHTNNGTVNNKPWVYSKPATIITSRIRQGQPSYNRTQKFTYSNANGLLLSDVKDPGTIHALATSNTYNAYGNLVQKTVSASGVAPRTEIFQYDASNRFVTQSYNADYPAIQTTSVYDPMTGAVSRITQPDGFTKNFSYDAFGRVKTTTDNNGGSETISNVSTFNHPNAPANAAYYVLTTLNTGDSSYVFYDRLGRSLRQVTKGLNGQRILVDEKYDNKGQLVSRTDPYFQGSISQNNTWTYDNLGRVIFQSTPSGNNTSFNYANTSNGALVSTTNAAGQTKKVYTDLSGTIIKSEDEGGILEYIYHSNGSMKTAILDGAIVQQTEYDPFNRQTKRSDPNYGNYEFAYDNFDQLLQQKDPKGNIYNFTYNSLGKVSTKSGLEGVYAYIYNTTGGADCGKLIQLTSPNGATHNYSYGRGDQVNYEERIMGNQVFKTKYTYDNYGRLSQTIFPNGTTIVQRYNANGDYEGVARPSSGFVVAAWLYRIKTQNAYGQTTMAYYNDLLGNYKARNVQGYNNFGILTSQATANQSNVVVRNYQYNFQPATGNLLQRKDAKYSLREDFTYDNVNRLVSIQGQCYGQYPQVFATQTMNYAANGNVLKKTDAGTFDYDQANRVSEISPYVNIPTATQNITYTPFDKVSTIEEGTNKAQFSYWPDAERGKMELFENGTLKKTKYYTNNFEREIDAVTGVVRDLCYIYSPDAGLVGIIEKKNGLEKNYLVLTDHLGSITHILDQNGNIIEEKSFDAWGRSRNPQTWAVLAPTGISNGWDRGYTGHEHLVQFGIVNMNGRLYDPLLGRMMEPDPLIIGEHNSQGYNRYSYALNNPLSYTDPDGHHPAIVGAAIAAGIGAAISAFTYTAQIMLSEGRFKNWNWSSFGFNVFSGAVSGAMTWGIGTALSQMAPTLGREALRAGMHGFMAYAFSGGDMRQALAGAAGSAAGSLTMIVPVLNTDVGSFAFSTGMGGFSSAVSGGNFLQGAVTAGLVHVLNQEMHKVNANMNVSEDGVAFIKSWEKLSLTVYDANPGKGDWTIGWGHKVLPSEEFKAITETEADELFLKDLKTKSTNLIIRHVKVQLTQQQYDALASYVFNAGPDGTVTRSQLIKHLNKGNYSQAVKHIDIVKGGGRILPGLVRRRADERLIWNSGKYRMHN